MKMIFSLLAFVFAFTATQPAMARHARYRNPYRSARCPYAPGPMRLIFCSPLVIQMSPNPQAIDLTSPADGVRFDLLGIPGQKQQISWFTAQSVSYNYFLTLPDEHGQVNGINELFGDNTMGPDQKRAANGFVALQKWDRNGDRVIDARDNPILMERLRLWQDSNLNGIAEPTELHPLSQFGIVAISLEHRPGRFGQPDKHGNEQSMPSVVSTTDGRTLFMFDLWFKLVNK